jgi:hypothetical protein
LSTESEAIENAISITEANYNIYTKLAEKYLTELNKLKNRIVK